ncbi:transposase family protein [Saccharopolyspora pogona]|uniref:transposase family protein n=1 Tax=Saccharopolyspora pogona TaxID=333966 RepID=UPI001CC23130|nr:transposase family protein [Saccharopolyspora pogona]
MDDHRLVPDLDEAIRGRLVLVDGTDVPTGNRAGHEGNYSGKRRRAGLNIQVAADTDGGLLGISTTLPGSMHDRKAFTECDWEDLLADIPTIADPAYQGTHAITPRKNRSRRYDPLSSDASHISRTGRYSLPDIEGASPNSPELSASSRRSNSIELDGSSRE